MRSVFGRDNLRLNQHLKASVEGVRSHGDESISNISSEGSDCKSETDVNVQIDYADNDPGTNAIEEATIANACGSTRGDNASEMTDENKRKGKGKEEPKEIDEHQRGRSRSRSRSRSRKGEGRKLNLWEIV